MRHHLLKKTKAGKSKSKLKDMDSSCRLVNSSLVCYELATMISCQLPHHPHRCVASCAAHLEELTSDGSFGIIVYFYFNLDPTWRQFRFAIGAPDAEAKFQVAVAEPKRQIRMQGSIPGHVGPPSMYFSYLLIPMIFLCGDWAFHGSPLKNWHSVRPQITRI
jgi:ubiquitin-conjugating enzyme E2 Q